jgi:hypothetical protein
MALASSFGWMQTFVLALPAVFLLARAGRPQAWAAVALGLPQTIAVYDVLGPRWERWVFDHSAMTLAMLALFALSASPWGLGNARPAGGHAGGVGRA